MKEQRQTFLAIHPMRRATDGTPVRDQLLPQPHRHRERDFGIGYGNSSGYGSEWHFLAPHEDPLFRCC